MAVKLSIVMPVYNVEAYVGKTLASVFSTTAPEEAFEVIVVNDGTEDGSMEVVRRFAERTNLTVLEQENQGLSAARMNGLALAKGEYVWFVDSDDYLVEDGVGKVLDLLGERPEAEVLMFPLRWEYEDSMNQEVDYEMDGEKTVEGMDLIRKLGIRIMGTQRFVIKRTMLNDSRLFFPKGLLFEDVYFNLVLICLAKRVHVFPYPIYHYLVRNRSIMTSLTIRSAYDMVAIHQLVMQFKERSLPQQDWTWVERYAIPHLMMGYTRVSSLYGTPEFNRFVRANGLYVWRQWLKVYPDRPLKHKLGRLFFCMMPSLHAKWTSR